MRCFLLVLPQVCESRNCRKRACRVLGNFLQPIRCTTQVWIVTRHQYEILRSFLRHHFVGKQLVASRSVGCFLRQECLFTIKTEMYSSHAREMSFGKLVTVHTSGKFLAGPLLANIFCKKIIYKRLV